MLLYFPHWLFPTRFPTFPKLPLNYLMTVASLGIHLSLKRAMQQRFCHWVSPVLMSPHLYIHTDQLLKLLLACLYHRQCHPAFHFVELTNWLRRVSVGNASATVQWPRSPKQRRVKNHNSKAQNTTTLTSARKGRTIKDRCRLDKCTLSFCKHEPCWPWNFGY